MTGACDSANSICPRVSSTGGKARRPRSCDHHVGSAPMIGSPGWFIERYRPALVTVKACAVSPERDVQCARDEKGARHAGGSIPVRNYTEEQEHSSEPGRAGP